MTSSTEPEVHNVLRCRQRKRVMKKSKNKNHDAEKKWSSHKVCRVSPVPGLFIVAYMGLLLKFCASLQQQ